MWRYTPVTNNWTWIKGSNQGSALGVYGTKCVTDSGSNPSHRYESRTSWSDADGNFWMFGGIYPASLFSNVLLNDVWMYCVSTNQWTWEAGDSTSSTVGNWGTIGVLSPSNKPYGRMGAAGWMDHNNTIYIFGGSSDAWGSFYNDLWKYTIDPVCGSVCIHTEGIDENMQRNELIIFPNPANSSLTISFSSSQKQTVELRIYNTLGKQIYVEKEEITAGKFEKEINVEKLSDGIYFLQLKTKEGLMNKKIMVQY